MAAQRGLSPSAVVGLDCSTCAYFFDDALVFREWAAQAREMKVQQFEQERQSHSAVTDRMRRELNRG